MTYANAILFHVRNAAASAEFYARLLELAPVDASPSFVMFVLPSGLAFGLWGREGVIPATTATPGGSELGFRLADAAAVDATCEIWKGRGARIALAPADLDFGRSFVALDPDGHRLRVYALSEEM